MLGAASLRQPLKREEAVALRQPLMIVHSITIGVVLKVPPKLIEKLQARSAQVCKQLVPGGESSGRVTRRRWRVAAAMAENRRRGGWRGARTGAEWNGGGVERDERRGSGSRNSRDASL